MRHFTRKVQRGKQLGGKIGFPTLNLNIGTFVDTYAFGVYACCVWIQGKEYKGALHFGPKIGSRKRAHLEIHVVNFHKMIYGARIAFRVLHKIRNLKQFETIEELKDQIKKDSIHL